MNLKEFEELKREIKEKGIEYSKKFIEYWNCYNKDDNIHLFYTSSQYPKYQEICDYKKDVSYFLRHDGKIIESHCNYNPFNILIIDGHFIKENQGSTKELWEYVADNYCLSVEYYGLMSKEDIMKHRYTDYNEGIQFFVLDVF